MLQNFQTAHKNISALHLSIDQSLSFPKKQQRAFCQKKTGKGNAYFCALQQFFGAKIMLSGSLSEKFAETALALNKISFQLHLKPSKSQKLRKSKTTVLRMTAILFVNQDTFRIFTTVRAKVVHLICADFFLQPVFFILSITKNLL